MQVYTEKTTTFPEFKKDAKGKKIAVTVLIKDSALLTFVEKADFLNEVNRAMVDTAGSRVNYLVKESYLQFYGLE